MGMNYIDAGMLKNAFLAGAKGLEANKEWINELNVFPVPDGDTGTNMTMTILSAAREVAAVENPTMEALARAISSGLIGLCAIMMVISVALYIIQNTRTLKGETV